MKRGTVWIWLAILGLVVGTATMAGCVYNNNDDDNNDGGDSGSGTVSGTIGARGSPGWGLFGALVALGAVVGVRRAYH